MVTRYCRRTIQRWVARYNQAGIKGLAGEPRSGRPAKLSVDQQAEFSARVEAGPKPSEGTATLYGKDIQGIPEKEFAAVYTLDGVYKLLHRLGYSCLKLRPRHEKADPAVQKAFKKTSQRGWKPSLRSIPANGQSLGLRMRHASANKVGFQRVGMPWGLSGKCIGRVDGRKR